MELGLGLRLEIEIEIELEIGLGFGLTLGSGLVWVLVRPSHPPKILKLCWFVSCFEIDCAIVLLAGLG